MAIDSVGSSTAIAAQFPPRPQQNTLSSGTDNRAVQNSQEESSSRIAPPPPPPPGEGNSDSGIVLTVQPQVSPPVRQLNPGPNDEQSGSESSDIQTSASERNQSPPTNSGSALNYSASGATNAPNSIGPAGRHLSLSV